MQSFCVLPGYRSEGLFSFQSRNGEKILVYVEASNEDEALRRYRALPVSFRDEDAELAVQVTYDTYELGQKMFFKGYFSALGIA